MIFHNYFGNCEKLHKSTVNTTDLFKNPHGLWAQ